MIKPMRDSSLHIAIAGTQSMLDGHRTEKVNKTFVEIFGDSCRKISEAKEDEEVEIVYEVQTPLVRDESVIKEFFENLEVVLEELQEFTPHFTQIRRGDN